MTTVRLRHVRSELALHQLREGVEGTRPLLLLHGLGERTPTEVPLVARAWPGAVWGLDFTGHGESTVTTSGGYTAEALMADVDHALEALAVDATVPILGRGLGGYVGLLIAGARPELVGGVVITDGPGLAGGGPSPHSSYIVGSRPAPGGVTTPDPYALLELSVDIRPADYATTYARQAVEYSPVDRPISVATVVRPPWLEAVVELPGVATERVGDALSRYSSWSEPRPSLPE